MKEVKEFLINNNCSKHQVNLLGHVTGEQKKTVLQAHHIMCLPSYREGMPNAVLEAMAMGIPVITRPGGGIKDVFQHDRMGYLTESKNPEIIAALLEKLILNRPIMIKMAKYNHSYAKKNFLASVVAKRLSGIYKDIISLTY